MSKFFLNKRLTKNYKKLEQTTSMELVGSFVAQLLPFFPQKGVKHCLCSRRDQVLLSLGSTHATGLRTARGACAERSVTVIVARSGAPRKIVVCETLSVLCRATGHIIELICITPNINSQFLVSVSF